MTTHQPSLFSGSVPPLPVFNRRLWIVYLIYAALLCGLFACLGFPMPHVDDPAYVGTAEHLSRTGQLDNPYMRNVLGPPYHPSKYLCQFPAYSYLLAAWMKVAGIGLSSVLVFYAVANFLNCLFAAWFFQRARLPAVLCLVFPWMLLSFAQTQGFRPDVTGLCAFWICLLCLSHRTLPAYLAASFFGSMAMLLWPVILGFVAPVFVIQTILLLKDSPSSLRLKTIFFYFLAWAIGSGISFFLFLLMIGFELQAFLHDFFLVAADRRPAGISILEAFLGLSWTNYNHLFLLSVLMLSGFFVFWSLRRSDLLSFPIRIWTLEILLGFIFAIFLYSINTQLFYFFFWLAAISVTAGLIQEGAWEELFVVAVLSFGLWIQTGMDAKRFLPVKRNDISSFAATLAKNPDAIIVFDEISYRYLFDLKPPPHSFGWIWFRPHRIGAPLSEKNPGQIWVIADKWLAFYGSGKGNEDLVLIP